MSNITKIMTFTSTVEQLIRDKAPGFTDRLPGQRELATRFNLSQSLVHIGMTELKKRGIIVIEPYKGASVATVPNEEAETAPSLLPLVICEDNPRQRAFWLHAIHLFEKRYPNVRISTRFLSSAQPLESAVFNRRNTVVVRPGNYRNGPLPCVPLSELLSAEILLDVQQRLLPGLHTAVDWSIALPFQLQVMAQIYDIHGITETPPEDFSDYLEWVGHNYGAHAIPVQNLDLLRDCCGLDRLEMLIPSEGKLSSELNLFLKSLETIGQYQLMEPACEKDSDQIRFLLEGRIRTTEVFSHRWTEHGIFQNERYRFARPRSATTRRRLPYFLSVAVLVGYGEVSEAERQWFKFLAEPELQTLQMQKGLGLSPYADLLKKNCGERLRDVAEWALKTTFEDRREPLLEAVWSEILCKLREKVTLPLLFGRMTAEEARALIFQDHLLDPDEMWKHIAGQLRFD